MKHLAPSILVLLAACATSLPEGSGSGGDGGVDAGTVPAFDGGGGGGGDLPDSGAPIGRGAIRSEICGNEFDDDDNGMIDDGCDCAVGTERPCWLGPPDARGVGVCHDGVQRCQSSGAEATWAYCEEMRMPEREVLDNGFDDDCDGTVDEPDGVCSASANRESGTSCGNGRDDDCDTRVDCDDPDCAGEARCPGGCDATETLCWGGFDDDCDGDVDCADSECAADPSCHTGPCPPGQTPTYRERDLGSSRGASTISTGPGGATMPMDCEESDCGAGQVQVVRVGQPPVCVPPPPDCPAGTHPNYVASATWRCDPPCDLIIHYGSIYGGLNVCAGVPDEPCPRGQVPTFVYETESWQCRPECDNSLYDRIYLDGAVVCVPC